MDKFLAVERVAFYIGEFPVYWYGIIICAAIIVAVVVACLLCKSKKIASDVPLNVALVILPTGILCGRLFAVLLDDGLELSDYFNFRTGGMSIIGAIVGGGLGLLVYCLIKREKKPLQLFDILCSVLLLAQAIGRWGNYFNSEVYGQVIDSSAWYAFFPLAVNIGGTWYQALFFYECVLDIIGFVVAASIFKISKTSGYTTAFYLIYYGCVRMILEPLRQSEYIYEVGGIQVSRALAFAMIAIGLVLFIVITLKARRKKGVSHEESK